MDLDQLTSPSALPENLLPPTLIGPNYYELLNVDASASRMVIREAYLRMKNLYSGGSHGLYGILSESDLARQIQDVELAFEVLNDDTRRADYDRSLAKEKMLVQKTSDWTNEADLWAPLNTGHDVIHTSRSTLRITKTQAVGSRSENLQKSFASALEDGDIGDGQFLIRLRDLAGVSQEEIQERTKISLEYIRNIEQNRFERLPQVVYVKGFLRSYLRYLNAPEIDRIVSAFATRLEAWQAGQK